ncbi:hypothetical protein SMACR_07249 [Sordaria macrospora]|uniref:Uncharacterized protein n=1 Tax=Sordaria macrospora TaxID=5147 RepID=A0A8S8ZLR6_SORMA|nr:hypothetical protein SMACR_07249 [Sordaria macrospora]WPJ64176.1 hypothetical protein SMAC4_07249 [Sordaria macrospora]
MDKAIHSVAFGRGDVLGLDGPGPGPGPAVLQRAQRGRKEKVQAWLEREDEDGDDDGDDEGASGHLGKSGRPGLSGRPERPGRPSKVLSPSPSPDPTLGSSPPVLSGLSIRTKDNNDTAAGNKKNTSQANCEDQSKPEENGKVEGQIQRQPEETAPFIDPYDSEASIAARPIVSHDPDHPNRPIDLDVKAARGVIRHVLESEKFPDVWPASAEPSDENVKGNAGGAGVSGAEGAANGPPEKGAEPEKEAEMVLTGDKGKGVVKGGEDVKGEVRGKNHHKGLERAEDAGKERVEGVEEQTGKKEVVIPKGVVMLVKSIQYLKMPPDTPSGSEVGSEYGYEDDSQRGSTPVSKTWIEKDHEEADGDNSGHWRIGNYSEDIQDNGQRSEKGHHEEIPETDLESTKNDSDIHMSNTDYLLPPSNQLLPASQQSSHKHTWSQRHAPDHSSSSSSPSLPIDPYIPPPPRPPNPSPSLPSQPPTGPPDLVIRLLLDDGEFWVQAILRPEFHHLVLGYDFDEWISDTESEDLKQKGQRKRKRRS